ncbi:MAG TPA: spore coat protein [Methylomusa anaerophila]|uniref:Coat F domain protein n=1 Tax=Methylomusa anaerophila TaxID=1930071 RepID=A0A348AM60_9FIRM|nr:spore coat protein [Methylomusa anaerophila]BBB92158.1 coat F domain protein [Methylomusa anaerophila]HML87828.1 spore coat protein [Methylomusa anaerophila]
MSIALTQKEKLLLQDQQSHEGICVQKYQAYASQAQDPQLKQLFGSYASQEQQHLNTLTQILNGQVPVMSSQQGQQTAQSGAQSAVQPSPQGTTNNQSDSVLCNDMLMTEKFVSGAYDTAIFEFTDTNVRQALNHIQKEEQKHGEGIFQYMQSKGMYNPK